MENKNKLLPVPLKYCKLIVAILRLNVKRTGRTNSTKTHYFIPEENKWYDTGRFRKYLTKNKIDYNIWENKWIIQEKLYSSTWIDKVVMIRYGNRLRHTQEYIKEQLKINHNYKPEFFIVKEDLKEEYFRTHKRFSVNYDYSSVPDLIRTQSEIFILKFNGDHEYRTNYNKLILRGDDADYFKNAKISITESMTTEQFIEKARKIHGDKYDYSEVVYKNSRTKIKIYCNIHHKFFYQAPDMHLSRTGCPDCAQELKASKRRAFKTREEFEIAAKSIHGDKYRYDKVKYINMDTKVEIFCNRCGKYFWQTPYSHLHDKSGCPICASIIRGKFIRVSKETWIERFRNRHGQKFDYSEIGDDITCGKKIKIRCIEHNIWFYCTPEGHLHYNSGSCPLCSKENKKAYRVSLEEFKERIINLYGPDRFDLNTITGYRNFNSNITIFDIASNCELRTKPKDLLKRRRKETNITDSIGCMIVKKWLKSNNIDYLLEYYVKDIIKITNGIRVDFRLIYNNKETWIEYNGEQHYKHKSFFNRTEEGFMLQKIRDEKERIYCKNHNIQLIEIPYTLDTEESIFEFLNKVLLEGIDQNTLVDYNKLYN